MNCIDNLLADVFGVLVLPEPQDLPSEAAQRVGVTAVPFHVARKFRAPPVCVVLRLCRVQRAPVPEAPINEDNDSSSREDDIAAATHRSIWSVVNSVSITSRMEPAADLQLYLGIATGLPRHALSHDLIEWLRIHQGLRPDGDTERRVSNQPTPLAGRASPIGERGHQQLQGRD